MGSLASLLSARVLSTEIVLRPAEGSGGDGSSGEAAGIPALPPGARRLPGEGDVALELPAGADVDAFLRAAHASGAGIVSVTPRRESLEDLFVREAQEKRDS